MKPKIAIIGGGAAGLSFACKIDTNKYEVELFEKRNRLGSKLLVAGKGGFNLSHSENIDYLKTRYIPSNTIASVLTFFDNDDLRNFFDKLGISTFIGSSNRIFPKQPTKPIDVLNALTEKVSQNNVSVTHKAEWKTAIPSKNGLELGFTINNEDVSQHFDYVVFALGGASWPVTGSAGDWLENLNKLGVRTTSFEPSNCAVKVKWPAEFIKKNAGLPLKNISATIGGKAKKGEIMITNFGMEGTPIYALSDLVRNSINQQTKPILTIDLKPSLNAQAVLNRLQALQIGSWTQHIQKQLKLSKTQMALLKCFTSKETFQSSQNLAPVIKKLPIKIEGLATIDEAISTIGGVPMTEVDSAFELKQCKNVFAIGEMLDWDAPTGGYLIQACWSMGQYLGHHFNQLK